MEAENKNLLPTLNQSQGLIVTSQIKIADAKNSDITNALKYVMLLLGTPERNIPSSLEMILIINFVRNYMKQIFVDEIRIAFDLAVAGKLSDPTKKDRPPLNLDLYGSTLSMKYVAYVLNAYLDYKKPLLKAIAPKEEEPLIGMDRGLKILELIKERAPETYEKFRNIGRPKERVPPPMHPYYDMHQRWMKQWDRLRSDERFVVANAGGRFVKRYGDIIDIDKFFNKKAEQLQLAKERSMGIL